MNLSDDCRTFGYVADDQWAKLPSGYSWSEATPVAMDSQDRVFVFNRGEHPVMVFDPDGTFLIAWGEGVFARAHGIHLGPDDTVYCTDDLDHTVRRFTWDGQLLQTHSYPEYIYEATKNKTRIVIGGSHGKTTITAMILHVMHHHKIETDFLVGAQLAGFDTMVNLTNRFKYAVIEGDEYLASPIDRRPKFHLYKPNIAILSGIAWDDINVFPTFEIYVEQFTKFINLIESKGTLIYCSEDKVLDTCCKNAENKNITKAPYSIPKNEIKDGTT